MLYDEEGTEVEGALSAEEVEEKLEEERVKTEEQNSKDLEDIQKQADEEKEETQKLLTEKEEELEKELGKEKNFGALRDKQKGKDEKIDALTEEIKGVKELLENTKNVVSEQKLNSAVGRVAGEDKELAEKVKFYYNSFKDEPKDDEEFQKRIDNALILAGGSKSVNVMGGDVISSAGGAGMPEKTGEGKKVSLEAVEVAKKMGITDQELGKAKLK